LRRIVAVYKDNADRWTVHLDTVPNRLAHISTILHKEESLFNATTFPKAIVSMRIRKNSPQRWEKICNIETAEKEVQYTSCRGSGGVPQL